MRRVRVGTTIAKNRIRRSETGKKPIHTKEFFLYFSRYRAYQWKKNRIYRNFSVLSSLFLPFLENTHTHTHARAVTFIYIHPFFVGPLLIFAAGSCTLSIYLCLVICTRQMACRKRRRMLQKRLGPNRIPNAEQTPQSVAKASQTNEKKKKKKQKQHRYCSPAANASNSIDVLPMEVLCLIFAACPQALFPILGMVCREWRSLLTRYGGLGQTVRMIDTVAWALEHGQQWMLQWDVIARYRRASSYLDGNRKSRFFRRQTDTFWPSLKILYHSMVHGVYDKRYEDATREFSKAAQPYQPNPKLLEAALRGGHIDVLEYLYAPAGRDARITYKDVYLAMKVAPPRAFHWMLNKYGHGGRESWTEKWHPHIVIEGRLDILQYLAKHRLCVLEPDKWFERALLMAHAHIVEWVINQEYARHHVGIVKSLLWWHPRYADVGFLLTDAKLDATTTLETSEAQESSNYEDPAEGENGQKRRPPTRILRIRPRCVDDSDFSEIDCPEAYGGFRLWTPLYRQSTWRRYVIAARLGKIDVLDQLFDMGVPSGHNSFCKEMAATGNLDAIRWMVRKRFLFDVGATYGAAVSGHFELFCWLVEHGCPWNEAECALRARVNFHGDIVEWIRENGELGPQAGFVEPKPSVLERVLLKDEEDENDDSIDGIQPVKDTGREDGEEEEEEAFE